MLQGKIVCTVNWFEFGWYIRFQYRIASSSGTIIQLLLRSKSDVEEATRAKGLRTPT